MSDWKDKWTHHLILRDAAFHTTDWYEHWYGEQLRIVDQLSASVPSILFTSGTKAAIEAVEGIKEYLTDLETLEKRIHNLSEDELQQLAEKAFRTHIWNPKDFLNAETLWKVSRAVGNPD